MRTGDVMTRPVVTVGPNARLKDVAATLIEHGINAVPVVDGDGRLLGIISEADLLTLEPSAGTGHQPSPAVGQRPPGTARHVMSQSVYMVTEDTEAAATARMLLRHNLKSMPVVTAGRVVGMVARRDLLRLAGRSDEDLRAELDRRLAEEIEALQRLGVEVSDGVVTVDPDTGPLAWRLLEALAFTVPGVVEVRRRPPAG